jgi:hypothetical protein
MFSLLAFLTGSELLWTLGHRHRPSGLALFGPEVGTVHVGFVDTALLKESKRSHSAAPIVAPQNAMNIGQLNLLIVRIPGVKHLHDTVRCHPF